MEVFADQARTVLRQAGIARLCTEAMSRRRARNWSALSVCDIC
jgi:hypothetical protein